MRPESPNIDKKKDCSKADALTMQAGLQVPASSLQEQILEQLQEGARAEAGLWVRGREGEVLVAVVEPHRLLSVLC